MDGIQVHLARYPNLPQHLGVIISSGKATLAELQSVYSLADAYHLLDVIRVDAHNKALIEAALRRQSSRGER